MHADSHPMLMIIYVFETWDSRLGSFGFLSRIEERMSSRFSNPAAGFSGSIYFYG